MALWRIILPVAVAVAGVLVLIFRPPARLGPLGSPLAAAAGLVLITVALFRVSRLLLAALVVIAATAGLVGGFTVWYFDRFPGQGELHLAVDAVAPPGFQENVAARQECDGWGCSSYVGHYYTGPGTADGVADQLVVHLRRACYSDAARVEGGASITIQGTCVSHDVDIEAKVTQQGSDVALYLGAVPRR